MEVLKKNILFDDLPKEWKIYYVQMLAKHQFDMFVNEPDYDCKSWVEEIEGSKKYLEQEYNGRLADEGYSFVKYVDEFNKVCFGISRETLQEYEDY